MVKGMNQIQGLTIQLLAGKMDLNGDPFTMVGPEYSLTLAGAKHGPSLLTLPEMR